MYHGDIEKEIARAPDLAAVKLVDIYKGKSIGENLKSITIRFTFSSMEKTLTDVEVNTRIAAILLYEVRRQALFVFQQAFQNMLRRELLMSLAQSQSLCRLDKASGSLGIFV